jgi:hypothetical protein
MATVTSADAIAQASNIYAKAPSQNEVSAQMLNDFTTKLGNVDLGSASDNLTPLLKNIGNTLGIDIFNIKESDINKIVIGSGVNFDINSLSNGVVDNNDSLHQLSKIVSDIDSLDLEKMRAEIKAAGGDPSPPPTTTTTTSSSTNELFGILSIIQMLNKADINQDAQIDKDEMENLVVTLNYALESAKIKKSLDDVKARNKVFAQSSGLSI